MPQAEGPLSQLGLRIAVIGSRGIPAAYGGFETFAQELAPRLVERGHEVTVYCRDGYTLDDSLTEYRGVRLLHTPALRRRTLEQLSHELTSILDSSRRPFQLYYFLGYRGAPFYLPVRASKRIVVVNTDGFEWKRRKWSRIGRTYLRAAEWMAARVSADALVSDSRAIADYYREAHGVESVYLPSGADVYTESDFRHEVLEAFGLAAGRYYLVVCRIEPENNVDLIVKEFIASESERELVIVGGMNYETPYLESLRTLARGSRIRFLGPVYGNRQVESLHLGAYAYVHGHEVGGTNPSLLQAMGCGDVPLALATPFNEENVAGAGRHWTKAAGSLATLIRWADESPGEIAALKLLARRRIADHYSWESIANGHDELFRQLARVGGQRTA